MEKIYTHSPFALPLCRDLIAWEMPGHDSWPPLSLSLFIFLLLLLSISLFLCYFDEPGSDDMSAANTLEEGTPKSYAWRHSIYKHSNFATSACLRWYIYMYTCVCGGSCSLRQVNHSHSPCIIFIS